MGDTLFFVCRRPPILIPFFFNNAIYRREPLRRTLDWYLERYPSASAAFIELHASETPFPFSRLAFAYRPVFVMDIDGRHTTVSARKPTRSDVLRLRTFEALRAGWVPRTLALPEEDDQVRALASQPTVLALRLRRAYYLKRARMVATLSLPRALGYALENLAERGTWTRLRHRMTARLLGSM